MPNKKISKEQIKKIAELSGLELSDKEVKKMSELLTDTLDYIDVLEELETEGTSETYQVTGLSNVFMKEGQHTATLSKEDALSNAREEEMGLFVTSAVLHRP